MGPEGGEVGNTGTGAARTSNDNQDIATEDAGEDDPARQRSVEAPEGSEAAGPDGKGIQEIGTEHNSPGTGEGGEGSGQQNEKDTPAAGEGGTGDTGTGTPGTGTTNAGNAAAGNPGAGKTLFATSCGGCHGQNGEGGIGPAMTDDANKWTLAQFTAAVRQGKAPDRELGPNMPRFSEAQLSDADLASIHAYVTSLN
ncbi:c-type cytochrome [Deinococcus malanensis]